MLTDIPTRIRSDGTRSIGHKSHLLRLHLKHEFHEFRRGIALDVELRLDQRTETIHIVAADMALVGTGMHRDAVGPESLAVCRHFKEVRHILTSRIAQSGYLVDVYA